MTKTENIVRIRPTLLEDLDKLAETLSMSRTEVVNHLIREYTTIEAERINEQRKRTANAIGTANR